MEFTPSVPKLVLQEQALPQDTQNSVSDGEAPKSTQKNSLKIPKKRCSEISAKSADMASNIESHVALLNNLPAQARREHIDFTASRDCDELMSGVSALVIDTDKIGRGFTTTWLDLASARDVCDLEESEEFSSVCYGGIVGSG